MPYGKDYDGSMFNKKSSGKSSAALRTGYQADCLRKYPLAGGANPLTNNYRKRYGGSNTGGASVGGGT